jgi:two-component system, chemotaxis family, response regulator Rcp1
MEILYIEDNPADVLLLKSAFQICDFYPTLHIAQDGVEGLEFLHSKLQKGERCPDLVLLDLNLPRKNGFDVLKDIRKTPALASLYVITYSGSVNPDDIAKCRKLKANDSWTKPQDFTHIIEIAERIKVLRPRT